MKKKTIIYYSIIKHFDHTMREREREVLFAWTARDNGASAAPLRRRRAGRQTLELKCARRVTYAYTYYYTYINGATGLVLRPPDEDVVVYIRDTRVHYIVIYCHTYLSGNGEPPCTIFAAMFYPAAIHQHARKEYIIKLSYTIRI